MRMAGTGGGSTQPRVQGYFDHQQSGGFGPGRQNRSPREVVRHDLGSDRDHKPQRRGCGCAVAPLVALAAAIAVLGLVVRSGLGGSTSTSGSGS